MQTCSRCLSQSNDLVAVCPTCGANLKEYSETAVALKKIIANPRVRAVHIVAGADACPLCQAQVGTYAKDRVPSLPVEGCSEPNGCTCFYQPVLEEIYP